MSPPRRTPKKATPKKSARAVKKTPKVLSTSQARANFAEALETAQIDKAVIGFDRYGRTVAALVPVEAVYMLGGQGRLVPAALRKQIARGAALLVHNAEGLSPPAAAEPKPRAKRAAAKTPARKRRRP